MHTHHFNPIAVDLREDKIFLITPADRKRRYAIYPNVTSLEWRRRSIFRRLAYLALESINAVNAVKKSAKNVTPAVAYKRYRVQETVQFAMSQKGVFMSRVNEVLLPYSQADVEHRCVDFNVSSFEDDAFRVMVKDQNVDFEVVFPADREFVLDLIKEFDNIERGEDGSDNDSFYYVKTLLRFFNIEGEHEELTLPQTWLLYGEGHVEIRHVTRLRD